MSIFSQIGESLIDEAIRSGELTPPPPGTKLDLETYFRTPEDWRSAHAMLRGQGFVPPEIQLLKRAGEIEGKLKQCGDPNERRQLQRELGELRSGFKLAMERVRGI